MAARIHYLTPKPEPIGHFIRYVPFAQWLTGIDKSRPLTPRDFADDGFRRIASEVATFAVKNVVDAVLVPSHFVINARSAWWPIDLKLCLELRQALDEMGGDNIRIDYSLTTTYGTLREPEQRRAFLVGLRDLPFDNLWLRVSDFGADATASAVRSYISAVIDFHALKRPLVADHVGGLAGLAIAAFGATGESRMACPKRNVLMFGDGPYPKARWRRSRRARISSGTRSLLQD